MWWPGKRNILSVWIISTKATATQCEKGKTTNASVNENKFFSLFVVCRKLGWHFFRTEWIVEKNCCISILFISMINGQFLRVIHSCAVRNVIKKIGVLCVRIVVIIFIRISVEKVQAEQTESSRARKKSTNCLYRYQIGRSLEFAWLVPLAHSFLSFNILFCCTLLFFPSFIFVAFNCFLMIEKDWMLAGVHVIELCHISLCCCTNQFRVSYATQHF